MSSVYQDNRDGRWIYQIYVFDPNTGQKERHQYSLHLKTSIPPTRREKQKVENLKRDQDKLWRERIRKRGTVTTRLSNKVDEYLELRDRRVKNMELSQRTVEADRMVLFTFRREMTERFGRLQLKKVTEDHIRDHITKGRTIGFTDKGCLSEPSLSLHLRHLRTFFNHFKGNGELTSNPIDGIKFDSPRRNLDVLRRDTPTGSDWDTLFDHVKTKVLPQTERPPTYLIHCLMRTGCRVGELIDLKWNPTEPYETLDGGNKPSYSYLTPSMDKMVIYSKRVLRSIDVSHLTDDVFKQLKTRFPQNKTYVFGNPNSVKNRRMDKDSGLPYYRSNIRRQFKVFLKECGLPPYPLHSLRRGFITRQVDNTQNIVQIGEYVGHTSTYMTEHYTRTDEQLQRVLVQGF